MSDMELQHQFDPLLSPKSQAQLSLGNSDSGSDEDDDVLHPGVRKKRLNKLLSDEEDENENVAGASAESSASPIKKGIEGLRKDCQGEVSCLSEQESCDEGSMSDKEGALSSSEEDEIREEQSSQPSSATSRSTSKRKERCQSRKSKNNALREIYSEAQRVLRQSNVALPYHRPKQRTLDEFLSRKKGTPEIVADAKKLINAGHNTDDVEALEKMLQEREKIAEEFFKDEDEEEESGEKSELDKSHSEISGALETKSDKISSEDSAMRQEIENDDNDFLVHKVGVPGSKVGSPEQLDEEVEESHQQTDLASEKLTFLKSRYHLSSLNEVFQTQPTPLNYSESNSDIILSADDQPQTIADKLIDRILKHAKAKSHAQVEAGADPEEETQVLSIVKKAFNPEGIEVLQTEQLMYKPNSTSSHRARRGILKELQLSAMSCTPGAQKYALKSQLQKLILEERRLKKSAIAKSSLNKDGIEGDTQLKHDDISQEETDIDEEINEDDLKEEEEEEEEEEDSVDDDTDEDDDCMEIFSSHKKKGRRIRSAFVDDEADCSSDEEEPVPVTNSNTASNELTCKPSQQSLSDLSFSMDFNFKPNSPTEKRPKKLSPVDGDEPLHSSQFETQKLNLQFEESTEAIVAKLNEKDTQDTVLLTLSNTYASTEESQTATIRDDLDEESNDSTMTIFKSQTRKKNFSVLSSSSDESEEEEDVEESEQKELNYDSEENEIVAPAHKPFKGFKNKKGRIMAQFLDKEAELSGSDVDPEDEDESGLDCLMLEDGDLDDIDEEEVRDEIGRIHHRQILDEDKQDVRLFQEVFLADGELHSDHARTRRFQWKGLDTSMQFIANNDDQPSDDEKDDGHEEVEESWRLQRMEREKWIEENQSHVDLLNSAKSSQFFDVVLNSPDKLIDKASVDPLLQKNTPKDVRALRTVHASPSFKTIQGAGVRPRGSFLNKDASAQLKVAELSKTAESSPKLNLKGGKKNFVFASKSPQKKEGTATVTSSAGFESSSRKRCTGQRKHCEASKRLKIDRSIDDTSNDTIFSFFK